MGNIAKQAIHTQKCFSYAVVKELLLCLAIVCHERALAGENSSHHSHTQSHKLSTKHRDVLVTCGLATQTSILILVPNCSLLYLHSNVDCFKGVFLKKKRGSSSKYYGY